MIREGEPPGQADALKNIGALEAAEERAFKRGRDSAELKAQVDSHEKHLKAINGNLDRNATAIETVGDRLDELKSSVEKSTAVARARADTAAELAATAAKNAVDKRTFILTGILCSAAIASVVIAALALGLGH
jgi:septal ring factor EnvC (AmiA/AmiB activator)